MTIKAVSSSLMKSKPLVLYIVQRPSHLFLSIALEDLRRKEAMSDLLIMNSGMAKDQWDLLKFLKIRFRKCYFIDYAGFHRGRKHSLVERVRLWQNLLGEYGQLLRQIQTEDYKAIMLFTDEPHLTRLLLKDVHTPKTGFVEEGTALGKEISFLERSKSLISSLKKLLLLRTWIPPFSGYGRSHCYTSSLCSFAFSSQLKTQRNFSVGSPLFLTSSSYIFLRKLIDNIPEFSPEDILFISQPLDDFKIKPDRLSILLEEVILNYNLNTANCSYLPHPSESKNQTAYFAEKGYRIMNGTKGFPLELLLLNSTRFPKLFLSITSTALLTLQCFFPNSTYSLAESLGVVIPNAIHRAKIPQIGDIGKRQICKSSEVCELKVKNYAELFSSVALQFLESLF